MMARRIQLRQLTQILVLVVLGIFWGASNEAGAAGNEARCNALGANCICSEPLNTLVTPYPTAGAPFWFNPPDTTSADKQCAMDGASAGGVIEDGDGFVYVPVNSGETITALPAGHAPGLAVLRTKTTAEGNANGGGNFIGTHFPAGTPTARRAYRMYLYFSPTWNFDNGVTCLNSGKIFQFGKMPSLSVVLSHAGGNYELYGWTGWNSNPLCCVRGPGADYTGYQEANVQGKWFRFELVVTNTSTTGPATTIKIYMKQITDNLPERTIIDTSVPTAQPVDLSWTAALATTLKPSVANIDDIWNDLFRNGTCSGYFGMSHLLFAAWSTDSGQRIGAAVEIEGGGGGGDTIAPLAPINLRISRLMEQDQ